MTANPATVDETPLRRASTLQHRMSRAAARDRVRTWLAADARNAALWTPVAIGLGVGLYFGLKVEPPPLAAFALIAPGVYLAFAYRRIRTIGLIFVLIGAGFLAADLRTARVDAPKLTRELSIRQVEGRLVSIDERADGRRLVIAVSAIDRLPKEKTPARIRVTWRGAEFDARPGDVIRLRAGLRPPPPPAAPGAFDFARQLYFQRIGAVGFVVTPPTVAAHARRGAWAAEVENLRNRLFNRIRTAAPGQGGAVVAAIVTGKRGAISEASDAALRDAGLAHLLAISGLHMGLATGLVFFFVRLALSTRETLALTWPIKKIAAISALLAGAGYLILSGGAWSARRAFIMTAILFAAILVDRRALSLRNVMIAAVVILLTTPEALFHPGFQMSFAAVAALIAAFEWWTGRARADFDPSVIGKFRRYAVGVAATDTIAAAATAPFALYHFHRAAIYSLPANLLAAPVMAFWVMPAAILALLAAPFGLDPWLWRLAAAGMDAILATATSVSGLPGAVSLTPQWPLPALLVLVAGGLWLCLSRSPLRLAALAALPAAAVITTAAPRPVLFVAASGENVGVVDFAGQTPIALYAPRRDRFSGRVWLESLGREPDDAAIGGLGDAFPCDDAGCVLTAPRVDGRIAVSARPDQLAEDCARAALVIALYPVEAGRWRSCPATLIDRRSVWRRGAHAIYAENGAARIVTARDYRGMRPWTEYQGGAPQ